MFENQSDWDAKRNVQNCFTPKCKQYSALVLTFTDTKKAQNDNFRVYYGGRASLAIFGISSENNEITFKSFTDRPFPITSSTKINVCFH